MIVRHIAMAMAAMTFAGALHAQSAADVALSFDKALVFAPGVSGTTSVAALKSEPKPVVVLMHGCGGLDQSADIKTWGAFLAANGYIVVAPDSFARTRQPSCDPSARRAGLWLGVHPFRLDEIAYAQEAVRKQRWFDGKNLVLMGYSEGAMASARQKSGDWNAVVITGWTCTNTQFPAFNGIFAPPSVPVLTVNYKSDPWYTSAMTQGTCEVSAAGRSNAKHVLLDGSGHGVGDNTAAQKAVLEFLKARTRS